MSPRHARSDPADDHGERIDDEYDEHHEYDEYDEYDEHQEYDGYDEYDGGEEYEQLRGEGSTGRRVALVGLGLLVFLALVAVAAGFVVKGRLDPSGPPGAEVRITIPTGSTNADIAGLLAEEGVVPDAQAFQYYLRYKGAEGFQAGDYVFRLNSAAWDALEVLRGQPLPPNSVRVTVPEGLTVAEYPDAIVDDIPGFDPARIRDLLVTGAVPASAVVPDAPSYEGLLFPDTYQVGAGADEAAVLAMMAAQFDRVATELDLAGGAARLGLTPYDVVIVASLIQEEYGIPEEMDRIARVIYNRLEIGEPLGIDATSRYEAELAGRDRNDIDFESASPYNTRRNAGLPPTAIAAPGRAALAAALNPADGPWIFYVRDPDESRTPPGGHFFTDSAREFAQVKAQCEAAGLGCG